MLILRSTFRLKQLLTCPRLHSYPVNPPQFYNMSIRIHANPIRLLNHPFNFFKTNITKHSSSCPFKFTYRLYTRNYPILSQIIPELFFSYFNNFLPTYRNRPIRQLRPFTCTRKQPIFNKKQKKLNSKLFSLVYSYNEIYYNTFNRPSHNLFILD